MTIRTVTHAKHQQDFNNGWDAMAAEIKEMGWVAARDKFNAENSDSPKSLGAYYYAEGGLSCLADNIAA